MDGNRFDTLTRSLAHLRSRRGVLRALGAAVAGAIGLDASGVAAATCRKGGQICRKDGDCCSRTCNLKDATGRRYCAQAFACTEPEGAGCCPAGQLCAVPYTSICCGGYCVASDESDCGVCGNACATGETCCERTGFGSVDEDWVCVNLQTSEHYCGTCGNACEPSCDFAGNPILNGEVCCGGVCTTNDVNNCNCEGPCPGPFANATVTCVPLCSNSTGTNSNDGGCFFECDAGFEDCDGDFTNGCETAVPPPSDSSCGLDRCNRQACPSGTLCKLCEGDGSPGICCPPGYKCGAGCTCQPEDSPTTGTCISARAGRFLR